MSNNLLLSKENQSSAEFSTSTSSCSHRNVMESCSSQWASLLASTPAPITPPTRTLPHIELSDVGVILRVTSCSPLRHSMRNASSLFVTRTTPGAVNCQVPFLLVAVQSISFGQLRNWTSTVSDVPLVIVAQPDNAKAHRMTPAVVFMLVLPLAGFSRRKGAGPYNRSREQNLLLNRKITQKEKYA